MNHSNLRMENLLSNRREKKEFEYEIRVEYLTRDDHIDFGGKT